MLQSSPPLHSRFHSMQFFVRAPFVDKCQPKGEREREKQGCSTGNLFTNVYAIQPTFSPTVRFKFSLIFLLASAVADGFFSKFANMSECSGTREKNHTRE